MAGLDFRKAAELFMGTAEELAQAVGISPEDVAKYRKNPSAAPEEVLTRMGRVLIERGRGMMRVGEMLIE